jgi:hypothetical protein
MTNEPVDLNKRRVDRARNSSEVDPISILREALRRVESGEWPIANVMVIGHELDETNDTDRVEVMHGGAASKNERGGILFRVQSMLLPG